MPGEMAEELSSLVTGTVTTCRVSSVLDRNRKLYGGDHMLTSDVTTCWNSSQGSPQQILLQFHRSVNIEHLSIMFQGGFVGQDVQLLVQTESAVHWQQLQVDIEPEDVNEMQRFTCPVANVTTMQIIFQRSTDFYGRVIIYRLDVAGSEVTAAGTS